MLLLMYVTFLRHLTCSTNHNHCYMTKRYSVMISLNRRMCSWSVQTSFIDSFWAFLKMFYDLGTTSSNMQDLKQQNYKSIILFFYKRYCTKPHNLNFLYLSQQTGVIFNTNIVFLSMHTSDFPLAFCTCQTFVSPTNQGIKCLGFIFLKITLVCLACR